MDPVKIPTISWRKTDYFRISDRLSPDRRKADLVRRYLQFCKDYAYRFLESCYFIFNTHGTGQASPRIHERIVAELLMHNALFKFQILIFLLKRNYIYIVDDGNSDSSYDRPKPGQSTEGINNTLPDDIGTEDSEKPSSFDEFYNLHAFYDAVLEEIYTLKENGRPIDPFSFVESLLRRILNPSKNEYIRLGKKVFRYIPLFNDASLFSLPYEEKLGVGFNGSADIHGVLLSLISDLIEFNVYLDELYAGDEFTFFISIFERRIVTLSHLLDVSRTDTGLPDDTILSDEVYGNKKFGAYFTPPNIADFIVKKALNTFFKLNSERFTRSCAESHVENSLEQGHYRKNTKIPLLSVLDPSCGAGIFLLNAAKFILDKYKTLNPMDIGAGAGPSEKLLRERYRLEIGLRKMIVRMHIYGVDLLADAVKFTKIILSLWCLEPNAGPIHGFRPETPEKSDTYGLSRGILGGISFNIHKGDALGGSDFYSDGNNTGTNDGFDWHKAFPEIARAGGFSVVLSNPPHGRVDSYDVREIYEKIYSFGTDNLSKLFLLRIGRLLYSPANLRDDLNGDSRSGQQCRGVMGVIVPKSISYYIKWRRTRSYLLENFRISTIINLGKAFPFADAEQLGIIATHKSTASDASAAEFIEIYAAEPLKRNTVMKTLVSLGKIPYRFCRENDIIPFTAFSDEEFAFLSKIKNSTIPLAEIAERVHRGVYIRNVHKKLLKSGPYKYVIKEPAVRRFYISSYTEIDVDPERSPLFARNRALSERIDMLLRPKIIFKVLRGVRITAAADIGGEFITTTNTANLFLKNPEGSPFSSEQLIKMSVNFFNTRLFSYYIQSILFGFTTESAIHLDKGYVLRFRVPDFKGVATDRLEAFVKLHDIIAFGCLGVKDRLTPANKSLKSGFRAIVEDLKGCGEYTEKLRKIAENYDIIKKILFISEILLEWFNYRLFIYDKDLDEQTEVAVDKVVRILNNSEVADFNSLFNLILDDSEVIGNISRFVRSNVFNILLQKIP